MYSPSLQRSALTSVTVGLSVFVVGGETTATTNQQELPAEVSITRDTTAIQLLELIGEPDQKAPLGETELNAEVWTYNRILFHRAEQVVTGMEQTTSYNPSTRAMITLPTPVTETKVTTAEEIT